MKDFESIYQLSENPDQYLDLWKWFTDDAGKSKDRMWTMASFFYTALAGLLGFISKSFSFQTGPSIDVTIAHPLTVLFAAAIGLSISYYTIFLLQNYAWHVRSGWNRADYIRFRIKGLDEIWCYDDPKSISDDDKLKAGGPPSDIPPFAKNLILPAKMFMFIYGLIFLLALHF